MRRDENPQREGGRRNSVDHYATETVFCAVQPAFNNGASSHLCTDVQIRVHENDRWQSVSQAYPGTDRSSSSKYRNMEHFLGYESKRATEPPRRRVGQFGRHFFFSQMIYSIGNALLLPDSSLLHISRFELAWMGTQTCCNPCRIAVLERLLRRDSGSEAATVLHYETVFSSVSCSPAVQVDPGQGSFHG